MVPVLWVDMKIGGALGTQYVTQTNLKTPIRTECQHWDYLMVQDPCRELSNGPLLPRGRHLLKQTSVCLLSS